MFIYRAFVAKPVPAFCKHAANTARKHPFACPIEPDHMENVDHFPLVDGLFRRLCGIKS